MSKPSLRPYFYTHWNRSDKGSDQVDYKEVSFTCPCCSYPTLSEPGGYNICLLCNWEDDGQDDPYADEVWPGPNKGYSLTQARDNFKKYWIMYSPDRDPRISAPDSDLQRTIKQQIMDAFDAMADSNEEDQAQKWQIIARGRARLYEEVRQKLREYEVKMKAMHAEKSREDIDSQ